MYADLLSGTKTGSGKSSGNGFGRLVCHHVEPLVRVCQNVSSKYTRSKVRKSLPKEFSYIIQELLHENSMVPNKQAYINVIISTIISTAAPMTLSCFIATSSNGSP